jgi:hypothetical protein
LIKFFGDFAQCSEKKISDFLENECTIFFFSEWLQFEPLRQIPKFCLQKCFFLIISIPARGSRRSGVQTNAVFGVGFRRVAVGGLPAELGEPKVEVVHALQVVVHQELHRVGHVAVVRLQDLRRRTKSLEKARPFYKSDEKIGWLWNGLAFM